MNSINTQWKQLHSMESGRLLEARGQLHQAVQILTAMGISFIENQPDDSHTTLLWDAETNMFLCHPFGPDQQFQLGVNPQDLSYHVLHNQETLLTLTLNGSTLKQVASDIQFFLEDQGLPRDTFTMQRHFELPDYPDRWSRPFETADHEAFSLLSSAYGNAYHLISVIVGTDSRAGALMTWPHHFDMATLLMLGEGKSIGIGMSPGDSDYITPYYYANVWPYPTEDEVQDRPLTYGQWHTRGWTGMVLPLNHIVQEHSLAAQESMVKTFLNEALQHGQDIGGVNQPAL